MNKQKQLHLNRKYKVKSSKPRALQIENSEN